MHKQSINSKHVPEAIGAYSHGTSFGPMIYTSGQLPIDANNGDVIPESITKQAEVALRNLVSIIETGGGDPSSVVKTTCFLADIEDFAEFNKEYAKVFGEYCPSRSCFAVKELTMGVKVEIEAIAYKL